MYKMQIVISLLSIDPSPVNSEVSVNSVDGDWKRNVSWLKPEIDDCITGYQVNIRKAVSL